MRKKNKERMTISEQLEMMRERFCDEYCKYTAMQVPRFMQDSYDQMLDEVCRACPLNDLKAHE